MRLLPLISVIALLSFGSTASLAPPAGADEAKYKSPRKPPPPDDPGQQAYKRPPNQPQRPPDPPKPPAERPPSKEHPAKKPPEPRRPPDPPPPPPYEPPRRQPYPPCPPPPPIIYPIDPIYPIEPPMIDPIVEPIRVDFKNVLLQRVRMLELDGFEGEVVVGSRGQVEFGRSDAFETDHDIGAVAQAFTAWAIYRLIESGELSTTTRIDQVFADVPDDKRSITIEQLLQHTSGLANTYAGEGETDRNAAVRKLLAQPLATDQAFNYSEDGYVILAAVIESATGMDYESFLAESGVVSTDMRGTREVKNLDWGVRGTGGLLSTARDLFAWTSHFLASRERVDITEPRAWTDDGVGIGYGWIRTGDAPQLLQTSAAMENGQNVVIVVYPHGTVLVVTSDRFNGDVPWSERVANELEPVMRAWNPYDRPRKMPNYFAVSEPN